MKKGDDSWIKTAARDIIAIGGVPFFILVLARVYMLNNPEYFSQFLISGAVFLLAFLLFKQNVYSGLGLITLVFTSMYYNDVIFTVFGVIAYALLLVGLFYLKEDWKKVISGVVFGAVAIGASYLAGGLLF